MSDNNMLVTLTKADLKQLIKDAVTEATKQAPPPAGRTSINKGGGKSFQSCYQCNNPASLDKSRAYSPL